MYPTYPPELSEEQKEYLLSNLKDWSIAHGLAVRVAPSYIPEAQDPKAALATTAPVTLFPSLFPRVCFDQAKSVAEAYNELYSAIASDEAWLKDIVEDFFMSDLSTATYSKSLNLIVVLSLVEIDDFMAGLWKVHLAVAQEGYAQSKALGLFRSDYMVHADASNTAKPSVKQVEFNTIASSFGGLSSHVSGLHQHLLSIDAYPDNSSSIVNQEALPQSNSVPLLAQGMACAHTAYGSSKSGLPTVVLFLVQDPERNVFDQRHVEYALNKNHKIRTFRLSFDRVLQDTKLDAARNLIYTPPHTPDKHYEATVIYFRAGYGPSEYKAQSHWDARTHLERSAAIKCPTVLTQLAGTKKVQQVLATPHSPHLSRFLPDRSRSESVLETFAPIYPLDTSEAGNEARKLATNPETAARYVLKPQREGGGNNIYRKAIPGFLKGLPETHWPAHILMEMIEPPSQSNTIFRNGEIQTGGIICELGIYGACVWDTKADGQREILDNFEAGYLLRTKGDQSEEGGVAAGFGAVDSPCLVEV